MVQSAILPLAPELLERISNLPVANPPTDQYRQQYEQRRAGRAGRQAS